MVVPCSFALYKDLTVGACRVHSLCTPEHRNIRLAAFEKSVVKGTFGSLDSPDSKTWSRLNRAKPKHCAGGGWWSTGDSRECKSTNLEVSVTPPCLGEGIMGISESQL